MFYGTRLIYNILYFVTAMSPAYILFLLQLNKKFNILISFNVFGINFNGYMWYMILLIFLFALTLILKWLLKIQFTKGFGKPVLPLNLEKFSGNNIISINGNVVSFLLGNIIPGVLIVGESIIEVILVFLLIQTLVYILIVKSTDIFPNVALIISGVDICKTNQGDYLLIFKDNKSESFKVYQIGDAKKSKLYITVNKK